MYERDKQA
ncbi:Protein of unknown function [Weissella confusa LBAE C39-2]|nr:Protein of unknown function [Weissella confusa LBAE C39-2]